MRFLTYAKSLASHTATQMATVENEQDRKGKCLRDETGDRPSGTTEVWTPSSPFFPRHPGGCCLVCGRARGAEVRRVSFNP